MGGHIYTHTFTCIYYYIIHYVTMVDLVVPLSITVSSDSPDHCADKWSSLMNKGKEGERGRELHEPRNRKRERTL